MVLAQASVSLRRRANRMGESRSPRPLFTFLLFYLFTFKSVLVKPIIPATGILRIPTYVVAAATTLRVATTRGL